MIIKNKMNIVSGKRTIISLFLIIILATFLRIYKLDTVPPSLNWDEADAAYNSYSIANWGRDEWGQFLPLVFKSFGDDKHPVHIYMSVPIIKLFGLSDFTARLSGAIVGILSVVVIFHLAKIIFKNDLTALLSALFLAVSPYHLQFSRGLWEVNFALFFFMLGLTLFFLGLQKRNWLMMASFLSFGICMWAYHSSEIVVPPIIFLLITIYFKDLRKLSINFYLGVVIFIIFVASMFIDPRLLGIARIKQTQFSEEVIEKTQTFQKTKSSLLGLGEITVKQYLTHFTPDYLFISGDQNPRDSVRIFGEFYKIDALFIFVGVLYLLAKKNKISLIIFSWVILSPIPSSLVNGAPNATRAIFMMGSLHLISALGASKIIGWFSGKYKYVIACLLLVILATQALSYLNYYFNGYSKRSYIDWQFGMKQVVEFTKIHPEYFQVFMTNIRSEPYIFFLMYLKTPLPDYLNTVVYNQSESKSFSAVSYFDKYFFDGWDPIESMPSLGVLYVVTPSQYDGLRHKADFTMKHIIYNPDGSEAFYLVSLK